MAEQSPRTCFGINSIKFSNIYVSKLDLIKGQV